MNAVFHSDIARNKGISDIAEWWRTDPEYSIFCLRQFNTQICTHIWFPPFILYVCTYMQHIAISISASHPPVYMNSMKLVIALHLISWKRLRTMMWHHNARVNSHQRWKQTRFRVCFHLWCELTSTINVTVWQVSWNSWGEGGGTRILGIKIKRGM